MWAASSRRRRWLGAGERLDELDLGLRTLRPRGEAAGKRLASPNPWWRSVSHQCEVQCVPPLGCPCASSGVRRAIPRTSCWPGPERVVASRGPGFDVSQLVSPRRLCFITDGRTSSPGWRNSCPSTGRSSPPPPRLTAHSATTLSSESAAEAAHESARPPQPWCSAK